MRYQLNNNQLTCTYEVYNSGNDKLLFSVGAHPAFAVPMIKDTDYTDYYLQFNKTEILQRWKLENGLISNHAELLPTENRRLNLAPQLFYEEDELRETGVIIGPKHFNIHNVFIFQYAQCCHISICAGPAYCNG